MRKLFTKTFTSSTRHFTRKRNLHPFVRPKIGDYESLAKNSKVEKENISCHAHGGTSGLGELQNHLRDGRPETEPSREDNQTYSVKPPPTSRSTPSKLRKWPNGRECEALLDAGAEERASTFHRPSVSNWPILGHYQHPLLPCSWHFTKLPMPCAKWKTHRISPADPNV